MEALIRLEKISKTYPMPGEDVHALKGLDLEIAPGEFLSVVGSSGSGKTTLLYLLGLLTEASSGRYHFDGRDVSGLSDIELSRLRAREIGFVFQAFHLLPQLGVLDNVVLAARYVDGGLSRRELRQNAKALLEKVGLGHRLRHNPQQLSGGEMQRVAIARALLVEPRLVLADEPTGNLDEANGEQIFQLLQELSNDGKTVILVTHDTDLAARTQRTVRLKDGEVIDEVRQVVA